jgi:hypothetical protein
VINGTGRIYYGRKNYSTENDLEHLDTTEWVVLLWLPILPLHSASITRDRRPDIISSMARSMMWSETVQARARRPLDWAQVGATYLKVYGTIALLLTAISVLE